MRMLGQCRLGIPGHCDHDVLVVLQEGDQLQDFVGLSRIGNRQNDILRFDHPQIAVQRFCRMDKKSRSAGTGKRCGDFLTNVARFANSRNHHFAFTVQDDIGGANKIIAQTFR